MKGFLRFFIFLLLIKTAYATVIAPQPIDCVKGSFTVTGTDWKSITLKITNQCTSSVDFQSSIITFENRYNLNTSFWGDFAPLSYPDNTLNISSKLLSSGYYLSTLQLHFPNEPWVVTKLPAGNSIYVKYGASNAGQIATTLKVYVQSAIDTGSINLINATAKPANVTQDYVIAHILYQGQKISDVEIPWSQTITIPGFVPGTYTISADYVSDSTGNIYQATATPATLNVTAGNSATSTLSYNISQQSARLAIQLGVLPNELAGYLDNPVALVNEMGASSSSSVNLAWNSTKIIPSLKNNISYKFSTPTISFNGYLCQPNFNPATLVATVAANPPTTLLSYICQQVAKSTVNIFLKGAPTTTTSVPVTFVPNDGSATVTQNVNLQNGSGNATTLLTTNTIYRVSVPTIAGFSINYDPEILAATPNVNETISYFVGTPVSVNGRLKVCGTQLCNQNGNPIQLKGMSSHGIQWYGLNNCLTQGSLNTLAYDFSANVMRISLYVQEGGYESNPVGFTNQVNQLINEASKRGIYALVDWHILTPGDPNANYNNAVRFFTNIANANKDKVNLIYEIANEPNGVNWATIKNYADKLIPVIRAIDPNTVIIVGTPGWSSLGLSDGSNSKEIINNRLNFPNVMYSFHFYAVSHRDQYLNELDVASNSLPIFVTEWGLQNYTGDGANDFSMSDRYINLMKNKKISWTNWNYSDDFRSGAVWKTGTCAAGAFTSTNLKAAGVYVRDKIKN